MKRTDTIESQTMNIMKRIINQSPTESRRFSYFSNFKESKRVRWTEVRHYVY